jgi:hypothetical protein
VARLSYAVRSSITKVWHESARPSPMESSCSCVRALTLTRAGMVLHMRTTLSCTRRLAEVSKMQCERSTQPNHSATSASTNTRSSTASARRREGGWEMCLVHSLLAVSAPLDTNPS